MEVLPAGQLECWNATQSVSGHIDPAQQAGVQTGKPWQTKTGKITKKKAG